MKDKTEENHVPHQTTKYRPSHKFGNPAKATQTQIIHQAVFDGPSKRHVLGAGCSKRPPLFQESNAAKIRASEYKSAGPDARLLHTLQQVIQPCQATDLRIKGA